MKKIKREKTSGVRGFKEKKMAYETKRQILSVNKKSGWCKLKTM